MIHRRLSVNIRRVDGRMDGWTDGREGGREEGIIIGRNRP